MKPLRNDSPASRGAPDRSLAHSRLRRDALRLGLQPVRPARRRHDPREPDRGAGCVGHRRDRRRCVLQARRDERRDDDASVYGYDRLSRLTSASEPIVGSSTSAYDPAGNRTSQVRAGTTITSAYDRADRLTAAGPLSVTVEAVGNLTAKGSDTFAYDQANRLTGATVAGTSETYGYDGDGVRVSRQVGANPSIRHVSDVGAGLPVTLDDGTRRYVWGIGLAYAVAGSALEVYHADRLGSVRALSDATGTVTATYRTDAWAVPTASSGSSSQPYGFTDEPRDATGLSYLRARYYDPGLGRFLSRDPWPGTIARPTSLNRCAYVGDNPVTYADPSGLAAPWGPWIFPPEPVKSKALGGVVWPDLVGQVAGFLAPAFKCGYAAFAVVEEGSLVAAAGTAAGLFVFGGAAIPGGSIVLPGVVVFGAANAAYNYEYTVQTIHYCLGGAAPTAPSTPMLPLNFPPAP